MPIVGHEANDSGKGRAAYVSIVLQFLIAVLLAFIGFTLQGLRIDTKESLKVGQDNAIAIGRILENQQGTNSRLDRLERTQDRTASP